MAALGPAKSPDGETAAGPSAGLIPPANRMRALLGNEHGALRIDDAAAPDPEPEAGAGARGGRANEPGGGKTEEAESPKSPWKVMRTMSHKALKISGASKAFAGIQNLVSEATVKSKGAKGKGPVINHMEWAQDVFKAMEDYADPAQRRCSFFWIAWFYVINPESFPKKFWDAWVLVLTLLSVFWVPYKAAFSWTVGTVSAFRWTIDIFFYIDMAVQFWTGYTDKKIVGGVERSKLKIAHRYLHSGFLIDLIATVPWDQFLQLFLTDLQASREVLSALYLLKVFRVARAPRLIGRISMDWTTPTTVIESVKFFLYVLICAHLMACMFFMIPTFFDCTLPATLDREYRPLVLSHGARLTASWKFTRSTHIALICCSPMGQVL